MSEKLVGIDTSNLLTILGLIAAIWTIIPKKSKLNFRLSVSVLDWLVIFAVFTFVHVLVFENVLTFTFPKLNLGAMPWGLDKNGAIYLSLFCLVIFIFFRSQTTKLGRRNIKIFENLFNNLLLTKQFEELAILINQHIKTVFAISANTTIRNKIAEAIRPTPSFERFFSDKKTNDGWLKKAFPSQLNYVANKLELRGTPEKVSCEIIRKLLATQHLTAYLAIAYPYLCIEILKEPIALRSEFSDDFIRELMQDETSVFYSELKNNRNLAGRYRYYLPDENKLLNFFFKDVKIAARLGIYKGAGETVCQIIDSDSRLSEAYNGAIGYYQEVGSFKCPIFCGIQFFEIMVLEGLHQKLNDHLWLHYFPHFTDKIVDQLRTYQEDDDNHEFPSIFQYLLYKIVTVNTNWIVDAQSLPGDQQLDDENGYISFQAVSALGLTINTIISSNKIGDRFKEYILEIALRRLAELQRNARMSALALSFQTAIIHQDELLRSSTEYKYELLRLYQELDHVLRMETSSFEEALEASIAD